MGNIREKPEKTKHSHFQRGNKICYATCSMCGWREFMEDSILSLHPFANKQDLGLFAIFDGHGGNQTLIQGPNQQNLRRNICLKF